MLMFEIMLLFARRKIRWIVVCGLIPFFFLLMRWIIKDYSNLLDFWIDSLSDPLFIADIFIPSIYILIVSDLIMIDFEGGYLHYILPRVKSRISWYLSKIFCLFFTAVVLMFLINAVWFMMGLAMGLDLTSPLQHPTMQAAKQVGQSPALLIVMMNTFFILGLTAIGTFILLLSTCLKHVTFAYGTGLFLGILSSGAWKSNTYLFTWLPMSQLSFASHHPFYPYDDPDLVLRSFTLQWSLIYLLILFTFSLLMGIWQMRKMNLSKGE